MFLQDVCFGKTWYEGEHFARYLSLSIADLQKLDGSLDKLAAKLVLQGAPVEIHNPGRQHCGTPYLHEGQILPANTQRHYINLHCAASR